MKLTTTLSILALALCAVGASAHECKVVCDAADKTPVCGSDGKTYASKCFLEFAKCDKPSLKLAHDHECEGYSKSHLHVTITKSKADTVADDEDEGESDSDSDSEQDLKPAKATKVAVKVEKEDKCYKECTRELEQLCGSDGKTYNNHCLFEIAQCRDKTLFIADEDGPCADTADEAGEVEEDMCNKGCSRELKPVCASNGKTYGNKCMFEIAKCRDPSLTITNSKRGCEPVDEEEEEEEEEREDKCEKGCTRELDQLCASDGKTYNNLCLFEIAQCRNKTLKIVDRDGPCPGH